MSSKLYKDLLELRCDSGLYQAVDCSEEENYTYLEMLEQGKELPKDVIRRIDSNGAELNQFYRVAPMKMTSEEMQEYIRLKQAKDLHTIRNCVVFFTVLTVIFLVVAVISWWK